MLLDETLILILKKKNSQCIQYSDIISNNLDNIINIRVDTQNPKRENCKIPLNKLIYYILEWNKET